MDVSGPEMRFCTLCDKLLPLNKFRPGSKRNCCHEHIKELAKFYTSGTQEKRAVNSLRSRVARDMTLFGPDKIHMSQREMIAMLNADQISNFSRWCIMPKNPTEPLSLSNAVLLLDYQRKYLIAAWKITKDKTEYEDQLNHLLQHGK